jgi:hypothetical protein
MVHHNAIMILAVIVESITGTQGQRTPATLLSRSLEPDLSRTSLRYAVTIAYIRMQLFNEKY